MLSENVYSMENELYLIDKALEPLSQTSEVLDLSGETVEIGVLKGKSGDLKHLIFSGANKEAIWIQDNKTEASGQLRMKPSHSTPTKSFWRTINLLS